ncbi:uncharacterized protein [Diadema antillarum]|uniref:uncharacterized protein n=1 Tax=Diadema antillarum TaxID=105358 RepID=UPI003A8590BE
MTTYTDGSFITVACMDGSTMTAGAAITLCQSDSFSFALTDVVCSLDCEDPAANQDSLVKSGETYQHGETATYTCAENYNTLHGPETTTCNNGEWSPLPSETSCRAPCYSPPASQPEGIYENGGSQTFTCDNSLDQASLECNDGSWSDPSFTCPEPVSTEEPFETTEVDIIVTDEATQRSLATDMTTSSEVSALFTDFSTDSFYSTDRKTTAVFATSFIEQSEAVTDGETIRMTESDGITVITETERVSDPDTSTLAEIATETVTQTTERNSTDTNTETVLSTVTGYGTDESTDVVETEADTVTATIHELRTDIADFTETVTSVVTRFNTDVTDEDITETIAVTNVYTDGDTNATQTEMLATKSATTDYAEVTFITTVDAFTTERTLLSAQTVTVSSPDPSTGVTENEVTDVFTERQTTSLLDVSASQTTLTDVETESATSIYTDQGTDRDATTETEGYTDEMTLGVTATDVVGTDDNVNTITERGGTDGISEEYTEKVTAFSSTDASRTENTDTVTDVIATDITASTRTNELTERPTMETANTAVYTQTENQQETESIEPTASRTATPMQTEIQTTVYTNSDAETSTDAAVTQTQTELDPASTSGVTGITTDTITSGERTDITTSSRTIRITTEVDEITDKRTTEAPEPTVPEEPCGTGSCTDGQYCAESSNGPVCVCQPGKEPVDGVCRDECDNLCNFETELCEANAEGGHSCSCRPGSTRDTTGMTGQCISAITFAVSIVIVEIDGENADFTDVYNDPNSTQYQQLATAVRNALAALFSGQLGEDDFQSVNVISFSDGSVVVNVELDFSGSFAGNATALQTLIFEQLMQNAGFANDTSSETPISLRIRSDDINNVIVQAVNECANALNDCSPDANCTDTDVAGGFTCTCHDGFTDYFPDTLPGRVCGESFAATTNPTSANYTQTATFVITETGPGSPSTISSRTDTAATMVTTDTTFTLTETLTSSAAFASTDFNGETSSRKPTTTKATLEVTETMSLRTDLNTDTATSIVSGPERTVVTGEGLTEVVETQTGSAGTFTSVQSVSTTGGTGVTEDGLTGLLTTMELTDSTSELQTLKISATTGTVSSLTTIFTMETERTGPITDSTSSETIGTTSLLTASEESLTSVQTVSGTEASIDTTIVNDRTSATKLTESFSDEMSTATDPRTETERTGSITASPTSKTSATTEILTASERSPISSQTVSGTEENVVTTVVGTLTTKSTELFSDGTSTTTDPRTLTETERSGPITGSPTSETSATTVILTASEQPSISSQTVSGTEENVVTTIVKNLTTKSTEPFSDGTSTITDPRTSEETEQTGPITGSPNSGTMMTTVAFTASEEPSISSQTDGGTEGNVGTTVAETLSTVSTEPFSDGTSTATDPLTSAETEQTGPITGSPNSGTMMTTVAFTASEEPSISSQTVGGTEGNVGTTVAETSSTVSTEPFSDETFTPTDPRTLAATSDTTVAETSGLTTDTRSTTSLPESATTVGSDETYTSVSASGTDIAAGTSASTTLLESSEATTESQETTLGRTTEAIEPNPTEEPCGTVSCNDGEYCAESAEGPVCVCLPGKTPVGDTCQDECGNACDFETQLCEENADGMFVCQCRPGRSLNNEGVCVSAVTFSMALVIVEIDGVEATFITSYTDPSSQEYQDLVTAITNAVTELFRDRIAEGSFLSVNVVGFSEGSVVADIEPVFAGTFTDDAQALRENVYDQLVNDEGFVNDTLSSSATSLRIRSDEIGDIEVQGVNECLTATLNDCAAEADCTDTDEAGGFTCTCREGYTDAFETTLPGRNFAYNPRTRGYDQMGPFFAKSIDGSERYDSEHDSVLDPPMERYRTSILRMADAPGRTTHAGKENSPMPYSRRVDGPNTRPGVQPPLELPRNDSPFAAEHLMTPGARYSAALSGKGPAVIYNDLAGR